MAKLTQSQIDHIRRVTSDTLIKHPNTSITDLCKNVGVSFRTFKKYAGDLVPSSKTKTPNKSKSNKHPNQETELKIVEAIHLLRNSNLPVTYSAVNRKTNINRSTISRHYKHLFELSETKRITKVTVLRTSASFFLDNQLTHITFPNKDQEKVKEALLNDDVDYINQINKPLSSVLEKNENLVKNEDGGYSYRGIYVPDNLIGIFEQNNVNENSVETFEKFVDKILNESNDIMLDKSMCPIEDLLLYIKKGGAIVLPNGNLLSYKYLSEDHKAPIQKNVTYKIGYTYQVDVFTRESRDYCYGKGLYLANKGYLRTGVLAIFELNPANILSVPRSSENKLVCNQYTFDGVLTHGDIDTFTLRDYYDNFYKGYHEQNMESQEHIIKLKK